MTVKIIKNYIILLVVFFSWVNLAHAGLEITEIMYAPEAGAGYDWVEIYNNGPNLDITGYRFFRGSDNENSTSGPITNRIGSSILKPNEYAILTSNMSDYSWLDFSGSIFSISSSIISLPSSGANTYIAISDPAKKVIDDVTYDVSKGGSKASKTSLSKINGEWTSATPTPGTANSLSVNSPDNLSDENTNDTADETADPTPITKDNPEILKITTKIIPPKIITAGIPFTLSSLTTTNRGETYAVGNFVWNFGDGMVRKVRDSSPFPYAYEYPGEYALTLSYFSSTFSQIADATNRVTIKVIPPEIFISSVGSVSDPYIEIENKSSSEIILSNWIVTAGMHYFTIPEGTTLLPNKKIKLSPKITGFVGGDIASVVITDPNREITATYLPETKKLAPRVSSTSLATSYINPIQSDNISPDDSLPQDSQVINLNDLGASVGESGTNIPKSALPILGLLVIIGIGVASFLLIKRKNSVEDYVEKGIRAEDMTIIE